MKLLFGKPPVSTKNAKLTEINLVDVIKLIKSDKKLKNDTLAIRSLTDKYERKKAKADSLPYILPFKYSQLIRNSKYFKSSEMMIFEADAVDDVDDILNDVIKKSKYVLAAYKSVSGDGFKFIVKLNQEVNSDYYLRVYNKYKRFFDTEFNITLDPANKDFARVQYLSHDSDVYYNDKCESLNVKETIHHLNLIDSQPKSKDSTVYELDFDKKDISKSIDYIRKHGFLESKNEQLWWQLAMSLASLGEDGRSYFLQLSLDHPLYPEDNEKRLNRKFDSMLAAWGNYHDEERVLNMSAFFNIIEKEYGYRVTRILATSKKSLELRIADKFVEKYRGHILFDHSRSLKGKTYGWYIWDGKKFALSQRGEISELYLKFIEEEKKAILKERERKGEDLNDEDEKEDSEISTSDRLSLANVSKAESRRLRDLTLTWASERSGLGVLPDELDENPELFNCNNGVINLRNSQLLDHATDFRITKISSALYQPNAKCPNWDNFISKICFNNVELIKYIQEAVGYSLTGHTSEQCLFFLYGIGANGKSTFLEGLKLILGEYQINANYETFTNMSREGNSHSEDIVRLKGSRLVVSSEINANKSLNESMIKQMTSGDTITARDLHASSIEFRPTFKIWISGNHKPKIQNFDYGIRRRIFIIPFEYTFKGDEIRPQYEVLTEFMSEKSGILNWALEGAKRWFNQKALIVPSIISDTTRKYFLENNTIEQFINDECYVRKEGQVDTYAYMTEAKELYQAYLDFIVNMNDERLGRNSFYNRMEELGYKRDIASTQQMVFRGIKLKTSKDKDKDRDKETVVVKKDKLKV